VPPIMPTGCSTLCWNRSDGLGKEDRERLWEALADQWHEEIGRAVQALCVAAGRCAGFQSLGEIPLQISCRCSDK
jgi:hypothetical protein